MKKTNQNRLSAATKRKPTKAKTTANGRKHKPAKKPIHPGLLFLKNRGAQTNESLLPYLGKVVAWAQDGSHVVDFDDDLGVLFSRLQAKGLPSQHYVYEGF